MLIMKIPEDVFVGKGITYNQKYPYGELAKVTKNKKYFSNHFYLKFIEDI